MAQSDKLVLTSMKFFEGQIKYLKQKHGKNMQQFIRVAVDLAIEKEKKEKSIN